MVEAPSTEFESGPQASAFAAMFARTPSPILVTDARARDNPITWVNDAFSRQTGYSLADVKGRNCRLLQGEQTDRAEIARIREAVGAGQAISVELLNYRKDGTPFWNAMTITPIYDEQGLAYFLGAQTDSTSLRRAEPPAVDTQDELEQQVVERTIVLRTALEQKTALLHEIDHRVKNNLQVISSLMLLKARRLPEGEAHTVLVGMAERIGALSIAHRLLYAEDDNAHFDLPDFVAELLADIDTSMADERVTIETKVEAIPLPASMAAPLALMIHELATNAVRHAFPGGRTGSISISARRTETGLLLAIIDDGIGIDRNEPSVAGFGRSIVEMVAKQLRGAVRWVGVELGTRVEVDVPLRHPTKV